MPRKITRLLADEGGFIEEVRETIAAKNLAQSRTNIVDYLAEVRDSGNPSRMVAVETVCIRRDLARFANTTGEVRSLEAALEDMAAIERGLHYVMEPAQYREIAAQSYSHPRNLKQGLPYDEARQSFESHHTRLANMDRSRLSDEHKRIIEMRAAIISRIKRSYIELQKQALNAEPCPKPEPEPEPPQSRQNFPRMGM